MNKRQIIDKIISDLPTAEVRGEMSKEEWYGWFEEVYDAGYKAAGQKSDSMFCDCIKEPWDGADVNGDCVHCGRKHK